MRAAIGLPIGWYWLADDAPPGYEALRVDGIEWAGVQNTHGEYAAKYDRRWFSISEAISRGWIRPVAVQGISSVGSGDE